MTEPTFKLGMTEFKPDAIKLKFNTYFNAAKLPTVPLKIGKPWLVQQWGMMANDRVGDCVIAGAAHETMLFAADAGSGPVQFDDANVLADYSAITGYVPGNDATDQGTDPDEAAKYRRRTGIVDKNGVRHKIDVYAALRDGDLDQLALAVFLFGVAGVGVSLPESAMEQFNNGEVWRPPLVRKDKILGGHYIPCVGRNSHNWLFVTWGRLHAATPEWVKRYMLGGLAYFSRERLSSAGLSPQGYDAAALNDDFAQVTS